MLVNNPNIPDRLLLFDGVCNLCNHAVQFIIRRDSKAKFKFAPLQSDYAQKILNDELTSKHAHSNGYCGNLESIVFILKGKAYTRSTAILKIMGELGFPWKITTVFYIFPKALRDPIYNFIAKHRYRWYGKKDSCMVPTPALRDRFLDL